MQSHSSSLARVVLSLAAAVILMASLSWCIHKFAKSREEAHRSILNGSLAQLGLCLNNYRYVHGHSVVEDAQQRQLSWREVLHEYTNLGTTSGLLPNIFRSPFHPDEERLTSFFAVDISDRDSSNSSQKPIWIVVFLANQKEDWTSTGILTVEDLQSVVLQQKQQFGVPFVTEDGDYGLLSSDHTEFRGTEWQEVLLRVRMD